MKISKIFAGISSLAIIAAMAIPAAAGDGAPIDPLPDGWKVDAKKTMASRFLIGSENDSPVFAENNSDNWNKIKSATKYRITITGDYFGEDGWDASGSITTNSTITGWSQADFSIGAGALNEDGTVNTAKNTDVTIYVSGNKYTIERTYDGGMFADDEANDTTNFCSLIVQSFNEDTTKSWGIEGVELLDANGNAVYSVGTVAGGDVYDPTGSGSTSTSSSSDDSTASSTSDSSSSSSGSTSSSGTSKSSGGTASVSSSGTKSSGSGSSSTKGSSSSSDKTANTGAAAGLALAGIALAGAAFVVSKKK